MTGAALLRALRSRGLLVLTVTDQAADSSVLIVYLHGAAGQWADGFARRLIAMVAGVVAVKESVQTPTILLVRVGENPLATTMVNGS